MSDVAAVEQLVLKYNVLKQEIKKVIVGQDEVVEQVLLSIFSGGHALLIGVPGLAKTLLVHTVADALGLNFKRIQFTPDLMPSDILGSEVLDKNREFKFIKGPIFSNIILADEINRTPPKTQAALLEAMQERAVTIAGHHYKLDLPYFVLATQNPIEQEGTYPLPEAQMDRFLMKITVDYPQTDAELAIVKLLQAEEGEQADELTSITQDHIFAARDVIQQMKISQPVEQYIVDLVMATRQPGNYSTDLDSWIDTGSSPRASIALHRCSRASAWLAGRDHVLPEDVTSVVHSVLRHRMILSYDAIADNVSPDQVIDELVKLVAVA